MCNTTLVAKTPRKSCIDVFNAFMLNGLETTGYYQIPIIKPTQLVPEKLVPFSEVIAGREEPEPGTWVHFYEDDVKFERFWRYPERYIDRLKEFDGVISPDYSLYSDFTKAQQIWNTNRNYESGAWMQQTQGMNVIANVRTAGWDSASFALASAPHNSTIAVGSHGCLKNRSDRASFVADLRMTVDVLTPTCIVVYGTDAYGAFDYPRSLGIPVKVFPSTMSQRLGGYHE